MKNNFEFVKKCEKCCKICIEEMLFWGTNEKKERIYIIA